VPEAVGEEAGDPLLGDLRDLVGQDRVAQDHAVLVVLVVAEVGGHSLQEPLRRVGGRRAQVVAAEEDLELKDVRQLVGDQLLELLVGHVDGQDHAVAGGEREGADPLRDEVQERVGLLEIGVRRVVDEVDRLGDLEIQLPRDVVVGALGVGGDLLQRGLLLAVEIEREVRRAVGLPVERVVDDLVLKERLIVLGQGGARHDREESGEEGLRHSAGREIQNQGLDHRHSLAWPLSHVSASLNYQSLKR
jgi:hypothetical protein